MNFKELYEMQEKLDFDIHTKFQVNYQNTFEKRVLAFLVELAEFANETRCFKYWSLKSASAKEIILEEYIDGIHFLLSLGIGLQVSYDTVFFVESKNKELTNQIIDVYKKAIMFSTENSLKNYEKLITAYLEVGNTLGFKEIELKEAYLKKNNINYQRLQNGY